MHNSKGEGKIVEKGLEKGGGKMEIGEEKKW